MGSKLQRGTETEQPAFDEAMSYYVQAALKGNALAMYNIGVLHFIGGHGVEQDFTKAMEWWKLAMARGHGRAAHSIAVLYMEGKGVEANKELAHEYFKLANCWDPECFVPTLEMLTQNEKEREGAKEENKKEKEEEPDEDSLFNETFQEIEKSVTTEVTQKEEERVTQQETTTVVEKPKSPTGLKPGFLTK